MKKLFLMAVALTAAITPQILFSRPSLNRDRSGQTPNKPTPAAHSSAAQADAPQTPQEREEMQARIYMAKKQYDEAERAYTRLSAEYPRNPSYPNSVGIAQLQQGKNLLAEKSFQRATKVNRRFADGYNNLGAIFYAKKDYRKAIRQYQRAISFEPNVAGLYSNLGYAYFALKMLPEAMNAFHKALAIDPGVFTQNDRNGPIMTYRSVENRGLFDFLLAKGYAQAGDAAHCAQFLRRASDDGYKELAKVRTDPDFAKVVEDPGMKMVLDELAPLDAPSAAPQTQSSSAPKGA